MKENQGKGRTFEERLRETLRNCSESEESYNRWLRERGLDRDAVRRAGRGEGFENNPELRRIFEETKREIDVQHEESGKENGQEKAAEDILNMPGWAIKA